MKTLYTFRDFLAISWINGAIKATLGTQRLFDAKLLLAVPQNGFELRSYRRQTPPSGSCEFILGTGDRVFGFAAHDPKSVAKTLIQQLRALELDRIISRTVHPQVSPKMEYELTDIGRELGPSFGAFGLGGNAQCVSGDFNPTGLIFGFVSSFLIY